MNRNFPLALAVLSLSAALAASARPVKLAAAPALTPDGATLVFEWEENLWSVPATGGMARALTLHPATDRLPVISPDGTKLAFMSNRDGTTQVYVMPLAGGEAKPVTFHSSGAAPQDWYPDGRHLLVRGARDSGEFLPQRFLEIDTAERVAEKLVFDDFGEQGRLSPDGSKLLFMRDGADLYRRNYRGSKAATIWLHDLKAGTFEKVASADGDCRSPIWRPDGKGFYFLNDADGCMNVWEKDLKGRPKQRTFFKDFSVILPSLSRDGSTMVFRQGFDFYRWQPGQEPAPVKLAIEAPDDEAPTAKRVTLQRTENHLGGGTTAFTEDGKQIVFSSGGRLWAMDTQLKDPVPVSEENTAYDTSPALSPDGSTLYFLRDTGDRANVWTAKRADEKLPWWQNRSFVLKALTDDDKGRYNLSLDPTGKRLAWSVRPGEVWVAKTDGTDARLIVAGAGETGYDWSPDGKWMVCSVQNSDDNRDVWIYSTDGAHAPYNVSRHPNWDGAAAWSPDGRAIAYIGRTYDNEVDIYYVWLRKKDHGRMENEIKRADAAVALEKKEAKEHAKEEKPAENKEAKPAATNAPVAAVADVQIDFDGLAERVQRVRDVGVNLANLFWSGDSKALAYHGVVGGKSGTWKLYMPNPGRPDFMCAGQGVEAWWTKKLDVLWVLDGVPALLEAKHNFTVHLERDPIAWRTLGFRMMWRVLRDEYYDPALNNRDWKAVLARYEPMIQVADEAGFERLASMMIGELNGSHMDYSPVVRTPRAGDWTPVTGHPGVRFDPAYAGPGLLVKEVLPGSPADRDITRLSPGDVVLTLDGQAVDAKFDLTRVLNGPMPHDVLVTVTNAAGRREFRLPLTDPEKAREFAKDGVEKTARQRVNEWSGGKLGYIDIEKMQIEDLREFEKKVFAEGEGHDGLVIDVRNNTGGYISDRLLAILCHPHHALTQPRGGTLSYQGSYVDHAYWMKPIVVLCNNHTASNGEIFSQAIKTLKRGKLVGTETQAAVISTGQRRILDLGEFRVPHRAWFNLETGVDMEYVGVKPDIAVPDLPGDRTAGRDEPLKKAVAVLIDEIKHQPAPAKPKYASELRKKN